MKTSRHAFRSKRGSAFITAIILTAGLAVMLASYHSLVNFNLRSSHRSYHSSAAMNLAETGLEEAMWAVNQKRAKNANAYDGWTITGDTATREFNNAFTVGTASATYVKVRITNCNLTLPAQPTIKAQARLSLPNGMPGVTKWVEITLDAPATGTPGQQGPTHPGLVAKHVIKFNGNNPTVDSWNSDPGKLGVQTHPYSAATKNDEGFVGSVDVAVDMVTIQNADIKGHVATANDTNLSNNVGPNGSILADDSPVGTKIDPSRVSTDFKATLPDVAVPSTTAIVLGPIGDSISLPRPGDAPAADGKYYYQTGNITLNNKTLTINSRDVVISAPYPYDIKIGGGSGALNIATGASLEIYAGRDVDIAGNGVANGTPAGTTLTTVDAQQPTKFKVWGTGTANTPQSIKIAGNGALSGVIYAPNADVTINGNGDVMGSVVANNITLVGNAAFHYDEALGQFAFGTTADTGDTALTIYRWRELLASSETTW
jgi:hypothetical protein